MRKIIQFDNAATTQPLPYVMEVVESFLKSYGSVHRGAGRNSQISTRLFEEAREYIINYCNPSKPSYALFTQNTTGAMSVAAHFFSKLEGKIAVSNYEHSSSLLPFVKAEGEMGMDRVKNISSIDLEKIESRGLSQILTYDLYEPICSLEKIFTKNEVKLVVITASSNLTGHTPPIRAMSDMAHAHGAMVLLDACQYIPHHSMDMSALGVDFCAASGHKFYAPYGAGFLIAQKDFADAFLPYQLGGGNLPYIDVEGRFTPYRYTDNRAHDPGTPNAVGVVAMAAALKSLKNIGFQIIEKKETQLSEFIFDGLNEIQNVRLFVSRSNSIITFGLNHVCDTDVANRLNDDYGISVRAGNFCSYNAMRLLLKDGYLDSRNRLRLSQKRSLPGLVRASINFMNTLEEASIFVDAIKNIAGKNIAGGK